MKIITLQNWFADCDTNAIREGVSRGEIQEVAISIIQELLTDLRGATCEANVAKTRGWFANCVCNAKKENMSMTPEEICLALLWILRLSITESLLERCPSEFDELDLMSI